MDKFILKYFTLIRTLIAILIGVALAVGLIYLVSKDPVFSLRSFLLAPFLSRSRLSNILEGASPIIFCGLAIAVAFQAKQFNVGAEGSLYLGAALGTAFAVSTSMPAYLHVPLTLLVAAAVGAAWGLLPGILKAKWKASELVSSLMLNYVGYYVGLYLINFHFRDKKAGLPGFLPAPADGVAAAVLPGDAIARGHFSGAFLRGARLLVPLPHHQRV